MNYEYVGYFTIVTSLFAGYFYVRDTLKGHTKPNRVSWFIWALAPLIGTGIQLNKGVGLSVLPTFMAGFIPLLVFIASFKNKNTYWKLKFIDYICFFLGVGAIVLWLFAQKDVLAITFAIIADAIAFIPTFIKSWKSPWSETMSAYIIGIVNALIGLLIVKDWIYIFYGFGLYLFIGNLLIVLFLLYRRRCNR